VHTLRKRPFGRVARPATLIAAIGLLLAACGGTRTATTTSTVTTAASLPSRQERTTTASPVTTSRPTTTLAVTYDPGTSVPVGQQGTSSTSVTSGMVLASALLETVVVENEHSGGYSRSLFVHWVDLDGNGCNAREDVLIDESLTKAQVDPYGCKVIEGDWVSAYDGVETTTPSEFDIDHVVALKEAWESGAWEWSPTARKLYANDLTDDRTLRAVSAASNRSKSDKDPSNWLPPSSSDLCRYLGDWVAIKVRWNLTMDQSEYGRIRNLLASDCAGLLVRAPEPPPVDVPTQVGGGVVDTVASGTSSGTSGDVYYANCSEARAAGAAPLHSGDPGYRPGLDRDHDGVACEG